MLAFQDASFLLSIRVIILRLPEYRQVKKEMQEYLIAKQTIEHILGFDRHKRVEEKKQQKEEQR